MLAARLTALGIPTLVVERNPNIGDNWANVSRVLIVYQFSLTEEHLQRYHNLVLHDPVYADHFVSANLS